MDYLQEFIYQLSHYQDYYLGHYQVNYSQISYFITPFLLISYYFLTKDERISRKRIREMNQDMIRNNAILESLLLTIGKMMKQQSDATLYLDGLDDKINNLDDRISNLVETNKKNFDYDDYENFKDLVYRNFKLIQGELKILHDATFLPDDNNDQDSDYEP